jgi:hypothetical protein
MGYLWHCVVTKVRVGAIVLHLSLNEANGLSVPHWGEQTEPSIPYVMLL